jgi:hypothetical protein
MNDQKTITLLQINDTHGYLEPHPELFWRGDEAEYRTSGGYARLFTIFNRVRKERNGAVIALDNGDTFHGTFHAVQSKGETFIDPVNRARNHQLFVRANDANRGPAGVRGTRLPRSPHCETHSAFEAGS